MTTRYFRIGFSFVIMVLLCGIMLAMALSAAEGDTCMITEIKGAITVNDKKAELLKMLKPGQTIKSDNAAAKVSISFFADGHIDTLQGKFEAKIGNNSVSVINGFGKKSQEILKPLSGTLKARAVDRTKAGAMNTRGISRPRIVNISPVNGELVTVTRPEFLWKRNGDTKYRLLTLKHNDTKREISLDVVEEGRLVFPAGSAPLEPGKWFCAFRKDSTTSGEMVTFSIFVASAEDLKLVKSIEDETHALLSKNPGDVAPTISLVMSYYNLGLYHKAQEALNGLLSRAGDNTFLAEKKKEIDEKLNAQWLK